MTHDFLLSRTMLNYACFFFLAGSWSSCGFYFLFLILLYSVLEVYYWRLAIILAKARLGVKPYSLSKNIPSFVLWHSTSPSILRHVVRYFSVPVYALSTPSPLLPFASNFYLPSLRLCPILNPA
jgi:hypothetical protein